MQESQEILLNTCYGGFAIPDDVRDAIFAMHPPDTELGSKFFYLSEYSLSEDLHSTKAGCILVEGYEDYCANYKIIKGSHGKYTCRNIVTKGDGLVWSIDCCSNYMCENLWRTHPDVIRLCKERGWIEKKFGYSKLSIATIPNGYDYRVTDYDGMEGLDIKPPVAKVLQDLLEKLKDYNYTPSSPFTEKLLKSELSIMQFLHPG